MNSNTGLSLSSASGSGSSVSSLVTSINSIPSELLSDKSLFDSVIGDNDLWSLIGDVNKKREILDKCLPNSLDNDEKEETVRSLFNGKLARFNDNPLDYIHFQLKLQYTSPDLLKTYGEVNQLKRRAYLIQEQKYQCKLLTEILTKRRILFEAAANSSPYGINSVTYQKAKSKLIPKNGNLGIHKRRKLFMRSQKVKERYKMELQKLFPDDEFNTTDDDSDLDLDVKPLCTKGSHEDSMNKIDPRSKANCDITSSRDEYITMMKKFRRKRKAILNDETDDPAMDFSNITLSDIISRVANDSGDDNIYEKSIFFSDLKPSSPFTLNSPKMPLSSEPINSIITVNRKKSKPSPSTTTTPVAATTTSITSTVPVNRVISSSLSTVSAAAPLLSRQLSIQTTSNSSQTSLGSSQFLLNNCGSLSPSKKSQNTPTIIHENFIKREPLDIFDFDNDSPPHSFPLPPLSLSSTTSNPAPATSFSSLISRPQSPHFSTSLPSLTSPTPPGFIDFTSSSSTPAIVTTTPVSMNMTTTVPTITTTTINAPLAMTTLTQTPNTSSTPTITSFVQPQIQPQLQSQQSSSPSPQQVQTQQSTTDQTMVQSPIPIPPPSENPPASFFSLIRDVFYASSSTDRKLTLHKLEELVKEKLRTIDSKVNWSYEMVQSAMNYLSEVFPPPDMIPLVDYKEKNQLWQWIGVNRDTDEILVPLCTDWLDEKVKKRTTSLMDPSQPVPPAICQTTWTVRSSSEEEKQTYRNQEALRYKKPHKAFTFTIHGYTSVVGPVKGCGVGGSTPHAASPNKAREHSLLTKDRPPFVTLLSLVRDAAARLPNGEGTRADICELLKDSQYLLPTVSDQQVNAIVSGALDRLHYEKDPCVKYDVNRKVWIYLHRNRSEEEFERLHEVQVAAAKAKRILNKTQRKSTSSSPSPSSITQTPSISTTIGNFSRINNVTSVTNFSGKPQFSAKATKSALGPTAKSGESQFETNSSTILTAPTPQQLTVSQPQLQLQTQLSSSSPLTSTTASILPSVSVAPTSISTLTSTLASTLTSVPVQTLSSTPTFSLVTSSNQQSISFLSSNAPLKASIAVSSPSTSTSTTNYNSIIPGLALATSSSGITLNSTSIATLTTASTISLSIPSSSTTTTNTLPNINLSSSSLQRLSIASPALKKRTHRIKTVKKECDSIDSVSTSKQVSYTGGTMTIAPMPPSGQIVQGFEKIVPNQTPLTATSLDSFTSLISGEKGSQVKQIRPTKPANSAMKVTPIVPSSVPNTTKSIDNVQHFLSLTTKATNNLPSNITITSSATKPIAPKLGTGHTETQQLIFPSTTGQTIFGKSILNPFETKQQITQTIQSSSQQQQATSTVQHQILKPILPAPIHTIQSQSQQQQQQSDKQSNTKLGTKHQAIQPQTMAQQIITLQPASIAVTSQSQQITIPKTLQTQQSVKPQQIQLQNNANLTNQVSADGKAKVHSAQITLPKQIQIQGGTQAGIATPTQISIPTSMLFGARPGSVVLATPGGKSYMMATSGGSIVLHPQVSGATTMQTSTNSAGGNAVGVANTQTTSLAVRTLQGIRVIPVTTGIPVQRAATSSLLGPNNSPGVVSPHHVVARIITTAAANQSPHGSATQAQIVIPSSSTIQPILLASPQQLPNRSE